MIPPTVRYRHWVILAATALLAVSSAGRAEAQFGIGITAPGVPFLYYTPERAPSPTDYLYDRERARISEYGNALQQEAAANRAMGDAVTAERAYFNRTRDYAGANTYDVHSRRSLNERAAAPRSRPPSRPEATATRAARGALAIEAYFLPSGALDWPRDAPDTSALHTARTAAESAIRTVRDEARAQRKARAQSIGLAKSKLVAYGKYALAEVKSTRAPAVATAFHYYLLILHDSLDQAAENGGP